MLPLNEPDFQSNCFEWMIGRTVTQDPDFSRVSSIVGLYIDFLTRFLNVRNSVVTFFLTVALKSLTYHAVIQYKAKTRATCNALKLSNAPIPM